jgi:hypothetical protein
MVLPNLGEPATGDGSDKHRFSAPRRAVRAIPGRCDGRTLVRRHYFRTPADAAKTPVHSMKLEQGSGFASAIPATFPVTIFWFRFWKVWPALRNSRVDGEWNATSGLVYRITQ